MAADHDDLHLVYKSTSTLWDEWIEGQLMNPPDVETKWFLDQPFKRFHYRILRHTVLLSTSASLTG